LERRVDESLEPFQRQCEVRAALRSGDRVYLVHDHRLDPPQGLACLRREQQEQRLRGRDEDVWRRPEHSPPLLRRGVSGAHGHLEPRLETRERATQVSFDVVVERLERRDVEQAETAPRRFVQAVDPEQERRERLARPCRRLDEDVTALRNHRPAELLGRRGSLERSLEPRPRGR
jgi:hypothetical protein